MQNYKQLKTQSSFIDKLFETHPPPNVKNKLKIIYAKHFSSGLDFSQWRTFRHYIYVPLS